MLSIENLLSEPFSTLDEEYLTKIVPKPLNLSSVMMTNGHLERVGLDVTEHLIPPASPNNPWQRHMDGRDEIRVFGVLELEKLEWLSEQGQEDLMTLMRARDNEGRLPGATQSNIKPSSFFGDPNDTKRRIKIVLSFKKTMNTTYQIENGQPVYKMRSEGNQLYRILSMRAECYKLSNNWFNRYQLFYLMKTLEKNVSVKVEMRHRTIEWFIEQYRRQIHPRDEQRRIIFDYTEDDPNVHPDGTVVRKRFLRHLANADLRGRFAEQCEWLLANQVATSAEYVQCFDTVAWVKFCRQVKADRKSAHDNQQRWGIPPNAEYSDCEFPAEDPYGMERFGGSASDWAAKLKLAINRKPSQQKKQSPPEPPAIPDFSAPRSLGKKRKRNSRAVKAIYDPDFSEDSTEGEPESDMEWEPEIRVPAFCLQAPLLTPGRTEWCCPGSGCTFSINFLEKNWPHIRNEGSVNVFQTLVHEHYVQYHIPANFEDDGRGNIILRSKDSNRTVPRYRRSDRLDSRKPRIKMEEY